MIGRDSVLGGSQFAEDLRGAMERVAFDRALGVRADAVIAAESALEPLLDESLVAPQTLPRHAEGPRVRDHLRLSLQALYAIADGNVRLRGIEEFARLRGYETDVEEIEAAVRGQAPFFEAFVLAHDAAVKPLLRLEAPSGGAGHAEGFGSAGSPRTGRLDAYLSLESAFRAAHPHLSDRERTAAFFREYAIVARADGHDRAAHSPAYRGCLRRIAARRGLLADDADQLEALVAYHVDLPRDFAGPSVASARRYRAAATRAGGDAGAFLSRLRAVLLLDAVCGRAPHDAAPLVNLLRAEYDLDPSRRAARERAREEALRRARQDALRASGLDGAGLMELLRLPPGPDFGRALRAVQSAAGAGTPLPSFGAAVDRELERRGRDFAARMIDQRL